MTSHRAASVAGAGLINNQPDNFNHYELNASWSDPSKPPRLQLTRTRGDDPQAFFCAGGTGGRLVPHSAQR